MNDVSTLNITFVIKQLMGPLISRNYEELSVLLTVSITIHVK